MAVRKTDRHSSGRSARNSVARPANYYARPDVARDSGPGFFPAIQHFTDSIAALPKEVMRHLALLKEVEAKLYGPSQAMCKLVDGLDAMPAPARRARQPCQDLLSFTANNSTAGSLAGSVKSNVSVPDVVPEDPNDMPRRREFHNLRMVITGILGNMDEKNVCLAEANKTLDRQLARVNAVLPYVETEVSEEARLGSLSHWAYTDMKKPEETRRNVAATNNLAAAAATVHENEIAAARDTKKRQPEVKKKQQQQQQQQQPAAPAPPPQPQPQQQAEVKKQQPPSVKRRKVEAPTSVPMERSASAKVRPKVQEVKKKPAPLMAVKKRLQSPSAAPSPSSPVEDRRPLSARPRDSSRKNSVHETRGRDDEASRHDRSRSRHILKQIASFNRSPVMGKDGAQDEDDDLPPDKQAYCYCGGQSYGVMIGCENEDCAREWFHLECCGLDSPPPDTVKWFCEDCDPEQKWKAG